MLHFLGFPWVMLLSKDNGPLNVQKFLYGFEILKGRKDCNRLKEEWS